GVRVQHRRGAKAKLADPRAENEGNKQSLLYRHLAANAWCFAWVIIGLDRADDGERIGVVPLTLTLSRSWKRCYSRNPYQVGSQIGGELFDMAGSDIGGVELGFGRKDIPLGSTADHLRDRIGHVRRRRIDEKIPVRIVLLRVFADPGNFERTESQGY